MPDKLPHRLIEYLAFARQRPELFSNSDAGIRVLLDPDAILEVERDVSESALAAGVISQEVLAGIVSRDRFFIVLRDAVEFPDGARRLHLRVLNATDNGAVVLPVLDGKIVLIRTYRHGPRRWLWECPRGGIEQGQTPEDAARAEVREEIGGEVESLRALGFVYGSSNFYLNGGHLFFAALRSFSIPQLSEAISEVALFSVAEVERMLSEGEILDSLTVAAFLHARLRGMV